MFFCNKVINWWHMLDQLSVDVVSINAFKSRLFKIGDNRMGFFVMYGSTGSYAYPVG